MNRWQKAVAFQKEAAETIAEIPMTEEGRLTVEKMTAVAHEELYNAWMSDGFADVEGWRAAYKLTLEAYKEWHVRYRRQTLLRDIETVRGGVEEALRRVATIRRDSEK